MILRAGRLTFINLSKGRLNSTTAIQAGLSVRKRWVCFIFSEVRPLIAASVPFRIPETSSRTPFCRRESPSELSQ
jgi:hypothetical protein